jgi:hypothetical protein
VGKASSGLDYGYGVGLLGNELRDNEAERVERNDGWRRDPFV